MKSFTTTIASILFLVSINSFAGNIPAGSWYKVDGLLTNPDNSTVTYTFKSTVLGYETKDGTLKQKRGFIYKFANQTDYTSGEDFRDLSNETLDQQSLTDLVTNCSSLGGTSETITVTLGSFATCKIVETHSPALPTGEVSSTRWFAVVPGGEVKAEWHFSDGSTYNYQVSEYSWFLPENLIVD